MKPRSPKSWELATIADHDVEDEATYRRLEFRGLGLSRRSAESVEFEQCRFHSNVDLSSAILSRSSFADCLFESANLANLRVEKSSMLRVGLSMARMTGLHWVDGSLRDVTVSQCRADLSSFRFTDLQNVVFDGCNLTRADFQNANVSGVQFVNCDLTGAQFSQATMKGTRLVNCVLAGIGGVTSFAGAIVAGADLIGSRTRSRRRWALRSRAPTTRADAGLRYARCRQVRRNGLGSVTVPHISRRRCGQPGMPAGLLAGRGA